MALPPNRTVLAAAGAALAVIGALAAGGAVGRQLLDSMNDADAPVLAALEAHADPESARGELPGSAPGGRPDRRTVTASPAQPARRAAVAEALSLSTRAAHRRALLRAGLILLLFPTTGLLPWGIVPAILAVSGAAALVTRLRTAFPNRPPLATPSSEPRG